MDSAIDDPQNTDHERHCYLPTYLVLVILDYLMDSGTDAREKCILTSINQSHSILCMGSVIRMDGILQAFFGGTDWLSLILCSTWSVFSPF